jgi:hypothetical protein
LHASRCRSGFASRQPFESLDAVLGLPLAMSWMRSIASLISATVAFGLSFKSRLQFIEHLTLTLAEVLTIIALKSFDQDDFPVFPTALLPYEFVHVEIVLL